MKANDVHTRHCCVNCGCKYGEDTPVEDLFDNEPIIGCSVVNGSKTQEKPCGQQYVCRDNIELTSIWDDCERTYPA